MECGDERSCALPPALVQIPWGFSLPSLLFCPKAVPVAGRKEGWNTHTCTHSPCRSPAAPLHTHTRTHRDTHAALLAYIASWLTQTAIDLQTQTHTHTMHSYGQMYSHSCLHLSIIARSTTCVWKQYKNTLHTNTHTV